MAFRQITATTTVQQILSGNARRTSWLIYNVGASDCFVKGDSSDTLAAGMKVSAGAQLSFSRRDGDDTEAALYAVTSAGTADIRVQESFESIINLGS